MIDLLSSQLLCFNLFCQLAEDSTSAASRKPIYRLGPTGQAVPVADTAQACRAATPPQVHRRAERGLFSGVGHPSRPAEINIAPRHQRGIRGGLHGAAGARPALTHAGRRGAAPQGRPYVDLPLHASDWNEITRRFSASDEACRTTRRAAGTA